MSLNGWLQIFVFIVVILLAAKPMGSYMTRVFERRRTFLDPVLLPCERLLYRATGVDPDQEMRWSEYAGRDVRLQRGNPCADLPG